MMKKTKPEYAVGFLFSSDRRRVLLIEKTHPRWQAGKLNGVGGRVEEGESACAAMVREMEEEADLLFAESDFSLFLILESDACRVHFFQAVGVPEEAFQPRGSDEPLRVVEVDCLPSNTLPTLRWAIPLSLDTISFPVVLHDKRVFSKADLADPRTSELPRTSSNPAPRAATTSTSDCGASGRRCVAIGLRRTVRLRWWTGQVGA